MNPSMRQSSYSRRSSILKLPKQSLNGNGNGSSTETSPNIKLRRRVSFAEKKHVKEFCNSLEQGTVWNNTYEEHDTSNSKGSNSSNEAQDDLRSCNQENQIASENQLHRNSTEDRRHNQECNNQDDGMDLTESIGISLATSNYTNINYRDSKCHEQKVSPPQLVLAEYNSNLPNASTYEEVPIEFTEVVRPSSIQPRNYTSVCQYIHALPSQEPINALLVEDVYRTSRMNSNEINEHSIEFTTPISTITAARLNSELDKENIIPQYSTFHDNPMEFTAPITVLQGRAKVNPDLNQEKAPLLSEKLLEQVLKMPNFKEPEGTLAFNDSSMEITKAVNVKSFPSTCESSDNDTKMDSSKTQIWCNDDMQMTTVVKDRCFIGSSESTLKARLNLQKEEEPITVLEDKTTVFQDNSMTITTAIPPCFRLANDAALLSANNLESNLVEAAPQDRECNMQFENQSIEITKAIETLRDKTTIFQDNSMTITTAIPPCFRLANDAALLGANNLKSNLVEEAPQDRECSMQFENQSIEITKAGERLRDKTTIFQDNSMTITTAIPPCFRVANDAALLGANNLESNLVEEAPQNRECSMQFENQSIEITKAGERLRDKTTIFQDNSMTMTTAIPPCFRLANDAALLGDNNLESNLVAEAPQDRECSMQFENQSIEITKAVETPGILSSDCMPNMENCLMNGYNKMSTACESVNKNYGEYEEVSMEITKAVNTRRSIFNALNIANKGNYPMENKSSVNIIPKSTRQSLPNVAIKNSTVPDLLLDKENCPPILQNFPTNERNMYSDRVAYPEPTNILSHEDYILEKEKPMDTSEKTTLDSSMRTDNTRRSDLSMELTSVTHIPTSLGSRDRMTCDALRNFPETISVQNLECNDNQMILAEEENDCVSTCASKTKNITTTDLSISNHETVYGIPNLNSNENPENETTCLQVITSTSNRTNQPCVMLGESKFEDPEEQETPLETSELFFHNPEEDLNSIKAPSFELIDDIDCNGENVNIVSFNDCNSNEEKVTKTSGIQTTTFAEPPTNSSISNDNENKSEFSSTYPEYADAGCNYQENNAARACYLDEFVGNDLRISQAFLPIRKSLGMTSLLIDDELTKQAMVDNAFDQACAENSIANSINCSSILLDRTADLMEKSTNSPTEAQPFETSMSLINESKNDSYMYTADVNLKQGSNPEIRNRLRKIFNEINRLEESSEKCVMNIQNNSTRTVEIVEAPIANSKANEEDVLGEEDPFSSLLARLKNMAKNCDVIWDIFHVNHEQRKIVIGFISSSLLVPIVLEDTSVDFVYFQIARLSIISRLKGDASDVRMRIAHRLILEDINTEAHLRSYKGHRNIFQLLEDITADVKLVLDFIIDLQRLEQLNLMTITDEQIEFIALTGRAEIILQVKMDIKVFSKIEPADIHIKCLLGTINEADIRKLIRNVKRDHKFLSRYMNDVRDYIMLMEN